MLGLLETIRADPILRDVVRAQIDERSDRDGALICTQAVSRGEKVDVQRGTAAIGRPWRTSSCAPTATCTFIGATIWGVKDHDQGIATYSVDGGTAYSIDDYSTTRIPGAALFTVSGLTAGTHTITITGTATGTARAPTTSSPWTP